MVLGNGKFTVEQQSKKAPKFSPLAYLSQQRRRLPIRILVDSFSASTTNHCHHEGLPSTPRLRLRLLCHGPGQLPARQRPPLPNRQLGRGQSLLQLRHGHADGHDHRDAHQACRIADAQLPHAGVELAVPGTAYLERLRLLRRRHSTDDYGHNGAAVMHASHA